MSTRVDTRHEEILAGCDEIVPLLAANAATSERNRFLAAESVAAMERIGLWRLLTPKRWGAVYDTAPIQSTLRDITTAARHAVCDFDTNAEMFGRVALGLDPGTPIV